MERLYVILDSLYELCLVLPDGSPDVRTYKQGIVTREDAEHLVGTLGRAELVPQTSSNARLHTVNTLIVPESEDLSSNRVVMSYGEVIRLARNFESMPLILSPPHTYCSYLPLTNSYLKCPPLTY